MPQFRYVRRIGGHAKLCQKGFVIHVVWSSLGGGDLKAGQNPLMIKGFKKRPAFLQRAQAVEPHGVEPLENIPVLTVAGCGPVLIDDALDFLETGDDALFARRAAERKSKRLNSSH